MSTSELLTIDQLAAMIAGNCHPCGVRTAWNLVNKNPRLIQRVKRGPKFVRFKPAQAVKLCKAINQGKAKR